MLKMVGREDSIEKIRDISYCCTIGIEVESYNGIDIIVKDVEIIRA